MSAIRENDVKSVSGIPFLFIMIAATVAAVYLFIQGVDNRDVVLIFSGIVLFLAVLLGLSGL